MLYIKGNDFLSNLHLLCFLDKFFICAGHVCPLTMKIHLRSYIHHNAAGFLIYILNLHFLFMLTLIFLSSMQNNQRIYDFPKIYLPTCKMTKDLRYGCMIHLPRFGVQKDCGMRVINIFHRQHFQYFLGVDLYSQNLLCLKEVT